MLLARDDSPGVGLSMASNREEAGQLEKRYKQEKADGEFAIGHLFSRRVNQ